MGTPKNLYHREKEVPTGKRDVISAKLFFGISFYEI
jgi:hypothetical protein